MDARLDDDVVCLLDGESRGVQVVDAQQLVSRPDARLLRSAVRFHLQGFQVSNNKLTPDKGKVFIIIV